LRRLVFIDFEASGLGRDGWPIEIGCAWISDGAPRVRASLIRPRPDWPMAAWSAESAAIHGITLAMLAAAPEADAVVAAFAPVLADATLVSDAPAFDQRWLDALLGRPGPRVRDFHVVAHELLGGSANALDWVYETLARTHAPHRAGPDARRLAKAMAEGLKRLA